MLKTSSHHKTCEMINAYLEIKPTTGLLLKNYNMATHAYFPLFKLSLSRSGEPKKFNSQGQREPEKATMETHFTKYC